MEVLVTEITPAPDDVLLVRGFVDGAPAEAHGWQSALVNHFPEEAYGEDGHRHDDAKPRKMTADEVRAYAEGLLCPQNAPVASPSGLKTLLKSVTLDDPPPEPEPEPTIDDQEEPA